MRKLSVMYSSVGVGAFVAVRLSKDALWVVVRRKSGASENDVCVVAMVGNDSALPRFSILNLLLNIDDSRV